MIGSAPARQPSVWAEKPEPLVCQLCGEKSVDVRVGLVRMRSPHQPTWKDMARCRNHAKCRERVEAGREAWPVDDGTAPTPAALVGPLPAALEAGS